MPELKPIMTFSNAKLIDISTNETTFSVFEGTFVDNVPVTVKSFNFDLPDLIQIQFSPVPAGYGSYETLFNSQQSLIPQFIILNDEMSESKTPWTVGEFIEKLLDRTNDPHTIRGGQITVTKHNQPKRFVTDISNNTKNVAQMIDSDLEAISKL